MDTDFDATSMEMSDIIPNISVTPNGAQTLEEHLESVLKDYPQGLSRSSLLKVDSSIQSAIKSITLNTDSGLRYNKLHGDTSSTPIPGQQNDSESIDEETTLAASFERGLTPVVNSLVEFMMGASNELDNGRCVPGAWKTDLMN